MYARVCAHIWRIVILTRTKTRTGTRTAGKGEDSGKAEKPEYICMFAVNEKKYKKS